MTEEDALHAYLGHREYEADVRHRLLFSEAALRVATAYRDHIVEPGWAESINKLGVAALGWGLMTATPIGLVGTAVYLIGGATVVYGVTGSTLYISQALARTFPWLPGSAANINAGKKFDAFAPHLPERENKNLGDLALDHGRDLILDRMLKTSGLASPIKMGELPTEVDKAMNFLEEEIRELRQLLDEIEQRKDEGPSLKPDRAPFQDWRPLPQAPIFFPKSAGRGELGGRDPSVGDSVSWAGPDEPSDVARNTA
jgi:hypothetical protein